MTTAWTKERPIETLRLCGRDPARWGEQHGEALRDEVRGLYAVRLELTLTKTDLGSEANALLLCARHLPVLERFDRALYDELCGVARGAGLTPAHVVLLNHYTDLRDLSLRDLDSPIDADAGCSVLFSPTPTGPVLGQTWDMHGSATDYVRLLEVPGGPEGAGDDGDGRTLLFTIAGCVGMTGLTSWGLGMTINNLNSTDARIGVVWPCLVRKALRQKSAAAARDVVLSAPLGSGHHYLVADTAELFGIETSGTKKKLTQQGVERAHIHTNHCTDPEMAGTCRVLPTSTTKERYRKLEELVPARDFAGPRDVWDALGEVSSGRKPGDPHAVATCGAFVMTLREREALACRGVPGAPGQGHEPTMFQLSK